MRSLLTAKRMPSPQAFELQCVLRARGMDDIADEMLLAAEHPGIVGIKVIGVPSVDPPIQASQVPLDHPYASGKAINLGAATLAAAATSTVDIVTAGFQSIALLARIGNATTPATALGDLILTAMAYEDDGTTPFPGGVAGGTALIATSTPIAAALTTSVAYIAQTFNVFGIDKLKLNLKNNNVAALQGATIVYYLFK